MSGSGRYVRALRADREITRKYYASSLERKTEQQKRLEALLLARGVRPRRIADIACGGGSAGYHLSALFPDAELTLVDLNPDAITVAEAWAGPAGARCLIGDVYELPLEHAEFDLVICWQTLSWLDRPEQAIQELIRVCAPGGAVYASSLFNAEHDVDVFARVVDHTRASGTAGLSYNTYSLSSVRKWVHGKGAEVHLHDCPMPIDLAYDGRGLGTHTRLLADDERLQISGGMLLNWRILELRK